MKKLAILVGAILTLISCNKSENGFTITGEAKGFENGTKVYLQVQGEKELVAKATEGTHYNAYIKDFFYGSEFYMFVNETFTDVRLVGAPPESIGKYGGDTDNWMWPRHTGDFCLFRVYSGKDGKPADYSEDNIPLKPKHHLPVSIKGIDEGDYAMIMGYPGSTDRYLSSYGVKRIIETYGPSFVDARDIRLKAMKEDMDEQMKVIQSGPDQEYTRAVNALLMAQRVGP